MEKEIINCRVFVTARFYDSRTEKVFTYFGPQSDQNEAIFDAEKSVLKLRSRRVQLCNLYYRIILLTFLKSTVK